ncbi:MAG TPA: endonuclease/exonuclease/phosphatase family protein [Streptosporangiaceae bacterium]|nr:endonuclease/exonuclease/phosphatase family protein [Streptosporangiaceae bacterium]
MNAVLALVLGAVALPPMACRALGGQPPNPVPKLAALAPAATLPSVAAVAVAATYAWWLALLLAVPAVTLVIWQLPPPRRSGAAATSLLRRSRGDRPGPPSLRMLTLNVEGGKASAEAVVHCLREYVVDVLAAQELTPGMARQLDVAGISGLLPFSEVDARPGYAGTGIWSRSPVQPLPPVPGLISAAPRGIVSVSGQPVTITAVHVLAPIHHRECRWQHEHDLLRSALAEARGAQLVAGDFNATRDHRPFRQLLAAGFLDCADAAQRRRWPAFTWPSTRRGLPIMRLDHVLASRADFVVRESRTIHIPGTDHRGVLATVELGPVGLPWAGSTTGGTAMRGVAVVRR